MRKKIGIAALVLVVAIAAVLGWLWLRVTALPDWYDASADAVAFDQGWVKVPDAKPPAGAPKDADVYVLRNAHLRAPAGLPVERAIKQSRISYAAEHIEAGAVVNMTKADTSTLSAKEREQFEATLEAFPALTGRDVYVGVEGSVRDQGGVLRLQKDAKLRVGNTSYSLASAAKRLGMSEAELREAVEQELAHHADALPKP